MNELREPRMVQKTLNPLVKLKIVKRAQKWTEDALGLKDLIALSVNREYLDTSDVPQLLNALATLRELAEKYLTDELYFRQ